MSLQLAIPPGRTSIASSKSSLCQYAVDGDCSTQGASEVIHEDIRANRMSIWLNNPVYISETKIDYAYPANRHSHSCDLHMVTHFRH